MALKKQITKEEFAKLPKALQSEYKQVDGDADNFQLDVEGGLDSDAPELKRAKDHEVKARKLAEKQLAELKTQLEEITTERDNMVKGTIPKADADKLESSYKKKLADKEAELNERIGGLTTEVTRMLVDNVAVTLANELSDSPTVLLPHLKNRLKAEQVDGKWVTRVLDETGQPSAATPAELKKEILANKAFAPIVRASKGSGGGAGTGQSGGSATGGNVDFKLAGSDPKAFAKQLANSGRLREVAGTES